MVTTYINRKSITTQYLSNKYVNHFGTKCYRKQVYLAHIIKRQKSDLLKRRLLSPFFSNFLNFSQSPRIRIQYLRELSGFCGGSDSRHQLQI